MAYHINDALYEMARATAGKGGALMSAGQAVASIDTTGCNTYHVVVSTLNGSDVLQVEGRINSGRWTEISAPLTSNTELEFTGKYEDVRVRRVSGTGTTTVVDLYAGV